MPSLRGRRAAVAIGAGALLTLAGTGIGFGRKIVERWHEHRLSSSDGSVRETAARRLAEMNSLRLLPYLIATKVELERARMDTGPSGVFDREKYKGIEAQMERLLSLDLEGCVPVLCSLLQRRDKAIRLEAIATLRSLGPRAARAAPSLVQLLDDPDQEVRFQADHALYQMGAAAVPALLDGFRSDRPLVRETSAALLEGLERQEPRRPPPARSIIRWRPSPGARRGGRRRGPSGGSWGRPGSRPGGSRAFRVR